MKPLSPVKYRFCAGCSARLTNNKLGQRFHALHDRFCLACRKKRRTIMQRHRRQIMKELKAEIRKCKR